MLRAGKKTNSPIWDFSMTKESGNVRRDILLNEIGQDLFIANFRAEFSIFKIIIIIKLFKSLNLKIDLLM